MFTGIIEAVGRVSAIRPQGTDVSLELECEGLDLADVAIGDSVAVSGVCLTVTRLSARGFVVDVSGETLARTTFSALVPGSALNLEKALTPTTRLGGHLVSGHVDGVGRVAERYSEGRSERFVVEAPAELARYIAEKGSICVEGVSLTVNQVDGNRFHLNVIPHTLRETTLKDCDPGASVNLEVDLIARYLERLLLGAQAASPHGEGVTLEFLSRHGFRDPDS